MKAFSNPLSSLELRNTADITGNYYSDIINKPETFSCQTYSIFGYHYRKVQCPVLNRKLFYTFQNEYVNRKIL
jgi:hypothetical protein